jgi:cell division septation protein DedD
MTHDAFRNRSPGSGESSWYRGCLVLATTAACLRALSWSPSSPPASPPAAAAVPDVQVLAVRAPSRARLRRQLSPRASALLPASAPARGLAVEPPLPGDELGVVPLPDESSLRAEPAGIASMAELARQAAAARSFARPQPLAPERRAGYELQVASFRDAQAAERYVEELQLRGHAAHARVTHLPRSGLWHRVHIGPFELEREALRYRRALSPPERAAALVVRTVHGAEPPPAGGVRRSQFITATGQVGHFL